MENSQINIEKVKFMIKVENLILQKENKILKHLVKAQTKKEKDLKIKYELLKFSADAFK